MKNLHCMTDEELALQYIDGNNKAFDLLLSRTQERLFTYIMFMVKDEEKANDIFQDTFVKVIVRLKKGQYVPSGKFSFWVTRIAHNVIMDAYRMQSGSHTVDVAEDNDLSKLRDSSIIDGSRELELINEQVLADVKHLMESLPAPQREVVYMRFYQELSFKEIAEVTGVSINTALGRMRYAIINMRRMAHQHDILLHYAV